ncbi:velvet factor-domain-containing protein [Gorgonomyces haynaldii]|nr:velvet factor-domain-containing protein [Gorgonomyces haynaldii]
MVRGTQYWFQLYLKTREHGPIQQRRDIRHVMRMRNDWIRFFPAMTWMLMPATLFFLPQTVRRFPSFLPTAFFDDAIIQSRLEALNSQKQKTGPLLLEQLKQEIRNCDLTNSPLAQAETRRERVLQLLERKDVKASDFVDYYWLFYHHIHIGSFSNETVKQSARYLSISKSKQELLIQKETIKTLTGFEIQEALEERGYPISMDVNKMQQTLQEHLHLRKRKYKIEIAPVVEIWTKLHDEEDHPSPWLIVVRCSLWELDASLEPSRLLVDDVLVGTAISSGVILENFEGEERCFAIFTDLSVRTPGTFRLNPQGLLNEQTPIVAEVMTNPFTVYAPKDYPGTSEQTALMRLFQEQGLSLPLRKHRKKRV